MTRKRNYDGESEACLDCKRFHDWKAPCETCKFRIEELRKQGEQR